MVKSEGPEGRRCVEPGLREHADMDMQGLGEECEVLLSTGHRLVGRLEERDGSWFRLHTSAGDAVLQAEHVVAVLAVGVLGEAAGSPPARSSTGGKPARKRGTAPGRPWEDDELRLLANAFLDGAMDKDLSTEFGRTPAIIKQLRQGFECARGNLVEDQITEVARSWVHRWQRVLTPE